MTIRESIDPDWLTKYSWRLGVFITLVWTSGLAAIAASDELAEVDPFAQEIISGSMELGMLLMVFSLLFAAIEWGHQQIKGSYQEGT